MTVRPRLGLADFCDICGRLLISHPVRRRGRWGAHPRQPEISAPAEPISTGPNRETLMGRWPR